MGFTDWVKDIVSVPADGYEEENEQETAEQTEAKTDEQPTATRRIFNMREQSQPSVVKPMQDIKVVIAKPETFEDGRIAADSINQKRTVVLNLEETPKDVCRRLIDFLSGVAYANGGQIKRVANCTYIVTPKSVDVMGDMIIDELESSGLYFDV